MQGSSRPKFSCYYFLSTGYITLCQSTFRHRHIIVYNIYCGNKTWQNYDVFAGGCSPHFACASGSWIRTKNIPCSSTSCRWTINGTGMRITSRRGWSRARPTRRPRTGSTRTPTHRSRAISCTRRSCRSKKSNSLTTKWISADRWVRFFVLTTSLCYLASVVDGVNVV